MFFWLKKLLTLPFLPLYFSILAGALGLALLLFTRRQKLARVLLLTATFVLALFSNKGVARLLIEPLEGTYAPIPEAITARELPENARHSVAVVVLGGGHGEAAGFSRVNQLSSSALRRLAEGVRLAHLLPTASLIVSGYQGPNEISHAQVLAEAAESLGIAGNRILRFDKTRDTDDEAQELKRTLGEQPFLLVTSAWHMPRAMALCEKAGLHPVAAPADYMLRVDADSGWASLTFDLGALERSTKAIHERLGLFWAKLRGRA
jgi:uncharacterized SAM-binding protein YcdF (DUF218 family)